MMLAALAIAAVSHPAATQQPTFNPPEYVIATAQNSESDRDRERETDRRLHDADRAEDELSHSREESWKRRIDLSTLIILFLSLVAFCGQWRWMFLSWREAQKTLRVAQSEVLFRHALKALQDAYELIEDTLDDGDDLDPGLGNLRNWETAAYLLKGAQVLRKRLMEQEHRVIYDTVERPRYERMFTQLLKFPKTFPPERFARSLPDAPGKKRFSTSNDYIAWRPLSVIYRFAMHRNSESETVDGEPSFDEFMTIVPVPTKGLDNLRTYLDSLRKIDMHH